MRIVFNFLSGHLDFIDTDGPVPDPLTVNNLIVNQLLTAQHIHGELAGPVYIHVKNTANVTIPKGAPVYVTGAVGETSTLEIGAADASDPLKMPAIGLLGSQLTHNAFGHAIVAGELLNLSTDAYAIAPPPVCGSRWRADQLKTRIFDYPTGSNCWPFSTKYGKRHSYDQQHGDAGNSLSARIATGPEWRSDLLCEYG